MVPYDDRSVGIGISYGDRYQRYGGSFSPYFDASLFYSQKEKSTSGDLSLGFTNSLSKKSFYQVGLNYQNSIHVQHAENYGIDFTYSTLY